MVSRTSLVLQRQFPDARRRLHVAHELIQNPTLDRRFTHVAEVYNQMPYDGARDMEVELAIGLRESGYGVWPA
jgi:hypothetical protein